jgi:trans-2-enoyl-CoA reductase
MIDSSTGATCSGTTANVSAAFGGASRTVSQMLYDAASQSNPGGSIWYGQVKATQVLAKDAFDAVNNQVAFAA